MVEQILSIEIRLRHASVQLLQEPEVAVDVYHRRHDGFACQINAHGAGRKLKLTFTPNAGEPAGIDDERGVFDSGFAVAHDEPRTFEQRHAARWRLRKQDERSAD